MLHKMAAVKMPAKRAILFRKRYLLPDLSSHSGLTYLLTYLACIMGAVDGKKKKIVMGWKKALTQFNFPLRIFRPEAQTSGLHLDRDESCPILPKWDLTPAFSPVLSLLRPI